MARVFKGGFKIWDQPLWRDACVANYDYRKNRQSKSVNETETVFTSCNVWNLGLFHFLLWGYSQEALSCGSQKHPSILVLQKKKKKNSEKTYTMEYILSMIALKWFLKSFLDFSRTDILKIRCGRMLPSSVSLTEVLRKSEVQLHLSEVCNLAKLLQVLPATNSTSERSFSLMKLIKTYLRSTMKQCRLNHLMILSTYKDRLDKLDLKKIASDFINKNASCRLVFGTFD